MDDRVLFAFIVLSGMFFILSLIPTARSMLFYRILLAILMISLLGWWGLAFTSKSRVEKIENLRKYNIQVPGDRPFGIIAFLDKDGNPCILDVHELNKGKSNPITYRRVVYSSGPFYGVMFSSSSMDRGIITSTKEQ